MRCANRNAHMKNAPVISAADYMNPVCEILRHALVFDVFAPDFAYMETFKFQRQQRHDCCTVADVRHVTKNKLDH